MGPPLAGVAGPALLKCLHLVSFPTAGNPNLPQSALRYVFHYIINWWTICHMGLLLLELPRGPFFTVFKKWNEKKLASIVTCLQQLRLSVALEKHLTPSWYRSCSQEIEKPAPCHSFFEHGKTAGSLIITFWSLTANSDEMVLSSIRHKVRDLWRFPWEILRGLARCADPPSTELTTLLPDSTTHSNQNLAISISSHHTSNEDGFFKNYLNKSNAGKSPGVYLKHHFV